MYAVLFALLGLAAGVHGDDAARHVVPFDVFETGVNQHGCEFPLVGEGFDGFRQIHEALGLL